ncbi:uncharacterized protein EDB91DRAFT_870110 [Suillus paluster]|uniref:uncharacterized protein n=1 Tax=Suillus paluster TaxID=48578 RepID=UPI001B86BE94|nr:uncharacterized protein EDB91DRAFT_870110 [Suillus paluster]KAG1748256.1 hypothetical protein EDB91DRAFT_870110 [Suillus paluster]
MVINFQRNPFKWNIDVKRDEGIRVRDIFEAIYTVFDEPLTPQEKNLIPLRLRAGCEEAFRLRCSLAPVFPTIQGWKRVDTLLHKTLFRGLTQPKPGGDWTLNLSGTMPRVRQDSNAVERWRLMSDPMTRHWRRDLMREALIPALETTASNLPPVPDPPNEYLPPYPNQTLNVPLRYHDIDLFHLPVSAAFVPSTNVDSDIMFPPSSSCRICNFAWLTPILQHGPLCALLNNIPPLIAEPRDHDYTWAFFCRFVPLGAFFDSPSRGPLPMIQLGSGRARLIETLEADLENPKNVISWLHGPSGTGKSVIAYNLAGRWRQKDRLAGSFFFSRRHSNCRSAHSLVLALAYQLGLSQPQAKEKIIAALNSDPGIISPSRDLREQFARLLVEPLEAIDWHTPARIFIIDAIDQCQDHVPELISLLTRPLSHLVDGGLHIFLTSRDEVEGVSIKRYFAPITSDVALDRIEVAPDMTLFFRQSFNKIHKRHRLQCLKPWPSDDVLDRLVHRTGPHFITGSVIVKFVESPDRDPIDMMDLIYHLPFKPSSHLQSSVDDLYKSIISSSDDLKQAYLHLTVVVNLADMLSCPQLENLLNRGPNQKFEMRYVLSQLSPLVHIPDGHDSAMQVCQDSLGDFLSDRLRCREQFISQAGIHRLLAYSSLSIMINELPDDHTLCSRLSRLATESSSTSLSGFDHAEVLSFAVYSPPEPLPFLSTLWHIMQHQYTGLTVDARTKSALGYFCCTWQILQHLDLSTVDTLPVFHFLANLRSLPVLLAFPIFLSFESPGHGQNGNTPPLEQEPRIKTLDTAAKIVNDVHTFKNQRRAGSSALDYACAHWAYHLSLAEWDDDLRSILTAFMRQKLRQWLVQAWCLQDFETCLRTLCEVKELCLTANPPIRFDSGAQRTAANMKADQIETSEAVKRSIDNAIEVSRREGSESVRTAAEAEKQRAEAAVVGKKSGKEGREERCSRDYSREEGC